MPCLFLLPSDDAHPQARSADKACSARPDGYDDRKMTVLPPRFADWFARQGWRLRPHQAAVLETGAHGRDVLLIAPTGGGKTLAGFLPSLLDLDAVPRPGLHTLYVSPLKALAADIARNLLRPVSEMRLAVSIATRSGDTGAAERRRQRAAPPNLLLTTPESLALLLTLPEAPEMFAPLARIIVDEVHALAGTKRGDQLALCLARLGTLAPSARRVGLSATVAHRAPLAAYIAPDGRAENVEVIVAAPGAAPEITMMLPRGHLPWSGHMGLASAPEILDRIRAARTTIVFVNTRAQAELLFQELWKLNTETLPIAIHHGSLEPAQRQRVEQAMAEGKLRAVVATSSLDLGIDWGAVDQVLQVGAPKGVSRLLQRVGRANHRMDEPSRAVLVPANRFEVLECEAAIRGAAAGELDGDPPRPGGLDVLAQHILGMACCAPFRPDDLYAEVRHAAPYADLARRDFDDVLRFVEDGGYALASYEQWRKLFRDAEGRVHVRSERVARQHRMNIGTIVEEPLLKVRLGARGPVLGEVEEYFANLLSPGDAFMFAGRLLRFVRLRETVVEAEEGGGREPMVPAYAGGRLPLSTNLAERVRAMLQSPQEWRALPPPVQEWLRVQRAVSRLPGQQDLLVETFPRGDCWYLVAYCFEGRNAHQTLGLLLTRRMQRFGFQPLGFVATDYLLATWSARQPTDVARLFELDMLGDDLEAWLAESSMLRRTFRNVAVIAGLIERQHPGAVKSRRQVTVNTDLVYDVLRRHQPDHVLLRATRADAAGGLTDLGRLAAMLKRVQGRVRHMALSRVSPLAVPALLEVGQESVRNAGGDDALLEEAALIAEAMEGADPPPRRVPRVLRPNLARRASPAPPRQGRLEL
jgi:ATP-dependent Lhr-like helicase